jgi:hypothetical protein
MSEIACETEQGDTQTESPIRSRAVLTSWREIMNHPKKQKATAGLAVAFAETWLY